VKVIAIKAGFYGGYRAEGDVFNVQDGEKSSWFKPVEDKPAPPTEQKPKK
jgi:hypothetical protein